MQIYDINHYTALSRDVACRVAIIYSRIAITYSRVAIKNCGGVALWVLAPFGAKEEGDAPPVGTSPLLLVCGLVRSYGVRLSALSSDVACRVAIKYIPRRDKIYPASR